MMRGVRGGVGGEPELCVVADCPNRVDRFVEVRPDLEEGYCVDHAGEDDSSPPTEPVDDSNNAPPARRRSGSAR
jgi:hypothetical protein